MPAAAVFDLDNTLVRGSSLFHFGRLLARRGVIPRWQVLRYAVAECRYVLMRTEREGMSSLVAERSLALVAGLPQEPIVELARHYAEHHLQRRLVADVFLTVLDLQRAGYRTYLATASPQELAAAIAEHLGMSGALGTTAEVIDGCYTGRLEGSVLHGPAKAHRVSAALTSDGVDLRSSFAFSDSANDVPLLSMVGHPVAVSPDPELRRVATANEWRILDDGGVGDLEAARNHVLFPFPY